MTEKNAEKRREIVRKIGVDILINKLGAETIDTLSPDVIKQFGLSEETYENYSLLKMPKFEGMTNHPIYLKMKNPSMGIFIVEGVDPNCKNIREALNFRKPDEMKKIPVDNTNGEEWWQQGDVCVWPKKAKSLREFPSILT